ncbi:MAG TPA: hypothetical protein VL426_00485 [Candidatus Binatia bacterium]|jgi:hypothetical protein|nr:hypothetical protein [Candidatus Binatia bacterium]
MGNGAILPVIARAVLLDRRERQETGRVLYAFLILEKASGCIRERPAAMRTLRELLAFVIAYRRANPGLPRVKFDPPGEVDRDAGKFPRRYEALELSELFFASSMLGQS